MCVPTYHAPLTPAPAIDMQMKRASLADERLFISDWLRLFHFDRQVPISNEIRLGLHNLSMEMTVQNANSIFKFRLKLCNGSFDFLNLYSARLHISKQDFKGIKYAMVILTTKVYIFLIKRY